MYYRPVLEPCFLMPRLTVEETATLLEINTGVYNLEEAEDEQWAADHSSDKNACLEKLLEIQDRQARAALAEEDADVGHDNADAAEEGAQEGVQDRTWFEDPRFWDRLSEVRESFMYDCDGLCASVTKSDFTALEKMKRGIYFTLKRYDFGENALAHIMTYEDDAEKAETEESYAKQGIAHQLRGREQPRPRIDYERVVKLGMEPVVTAHALTLPLQRIRADTQISLTKEGAVHREHKESLTSQRVAFVYDVLEALGYTFGAGQPLETLGDLLCPNLTFESTELPDEERPTAEEGENVVQHASWLDVFNRLQIAKSNPDFYDGRDETKEGDEQCCNRVKRVLRKDEYKALTRGENIDQAGLPKLVQAVLGQIYLKNEVTINNKKKYTPRGGKQAVGVVKCVGPFVWKSRELVDRVAIRLPAELGGERVPSSQYREEERSRRAKREEERIEGDGSSFVSRPHFPPQPLMTRHFQPGAPFTPLRRKEAVDAKRLVWLLRELKRGEVARVARIAELGAVYRGAGLSQARKDEVRLERRMHKKAQDMLALLRQLDAICSEPDGEGLRWHVVAYKQARLGRMYAVSTSIQCLTKDDVEVEATEWRSVSLQGMFSELRPLLAPFLSDIDMVKAFATMYKNLARRNGWTIPKIVEYADHGDDVLKRIIEHHQLKVKMSETDAKAAAKELVNSTLNFGGYGTWLEKHCLHGSEQLEWVNELKEEVTTLRELVFDNDEYADTIATERELVRGELSQGGHDPEDYEVDRRVWARFSHARENEIIRLIDGYFRRKWGNSVIMSLIFDGLMGKTVSAHKARTVLTFNFLREHEQGRIREVIDDVERWLRDHHDWDIKLLEKPNLGSPRALPPTLAKSNAMLNVVDADAEAAAEEDVAHANVIDNLIFSTLTAALPLEAEAYLTGDRDSGALAPVWEADVEGRARAVAMRGGGVSSWDSCSASSSRMSP